MWRAPISPEFTVHCFKNLNLSVRSPWTWATTCLQRALINVYMTPGSWGQQKCQAETDEMALPPNGTPFLKRIPLLCARHCTPRSLEAPLTVQEESQGTLSVVGGKPAVGKEADLPGDPWLLGSLSWPKRALSAAPLATGLWQQHPAPGHRGLLLAVNQGIS